jgi:opacity protein-like surface antigen
MKNSLRFALWAFAIVLALPAEAAAQWYAGAEAGLCFATFRAKYDFKIGTPDSYVNHASGFEAGVLLGYDLRLNRTLTLGLEFVSATNRARWEMETFDVYQGTPKGGASHLAYEIPWHVGAAAVLKVRILPRLALRAEAGLGRGKIREIKTSLTSTNYEFDDWVPYLGAGAGLEWRFSRRLELVGRFTWVEYGSFSYTSRFPDGELWETISDQPSAVSLRIGMNYRFGDR